LRPPTRPTIIDHLFGISFLTVRWYGVLIVSGAILAGYLATRQAIGRWGNFFNQEAYGRPTILPSVGLVWLR
jgi:prolipoprotein diacylglyceryltransferase